MDNRLKTVGKTDTGLRVANYLALYGGRDLEGEYFTPETDFESKYTKTGRLYVDWEHGMGKRADGPDAPGRDDVLGYVDWTTVKRDERGLWGERVLDRRNEYMEFIETLIEEGLVGTSTEAAEGVEKTEDGEIKRWPLKRDALTVTPAEPRMMTENAISALKSLAEVYPHMKALLKGVDGTEAVASDNGEQKQTITVVQESKMSEEKAVSLTEEEYKELLRAGVTPKEEETLSPEIKAMLEQMAAVQKTQNEMLDMIQKAPVLKDTGIVSPDSEEDHADRKSFGDFLVAIRNNNTKRLKEVYKAALAEGSGVTGGYLVPQEFGGEMEIRINSQVLLRKHGAPVSQMTARSKEHWVLDVETAPSAGSTAGAGGVVGYWISEAGSITESEPQFRLIELVAHKLAAYALASSEVRADAAETIDGLLARSFVNELAAQENYAHFRGDGVGKPLGILNSSAWSAQTRSAASAVALADLAKIVANFMPNTPGLWVMDPGAWEKVVVLVSNPLSFLNDLNEAPPTQLLGWPVEVFGGLPALNTAGDVMLVAPSYYLIGERSGIQIAFSEHFKFQNDQLAWRVTRRIDGQPIINGAVTAEDASTTYNPFVGLAAG